MTNLIRTETEGDIFRLYLYLVEEKEKRKFYGISGCNQLMRVREENSLGSSVMKRIENGGRKSLFRVIKSLGKHVFPHVASPFFFPLNKQNKAFLSSFLQLFLFSTHFRFESSPVGENFLFQEKLSILPV